MTDRLLTDEEIRTIRKHQSFLDPTWSADRENAMIRAGAQAQDTKTLKAVGEWINELDNGTRSSASWRFEVRKLRDQLKQGRMPGGAG